MSARFEYRTTFARIPHDFPNHDRISEDLSHIVPKPPRSEDWQLVSATTVVTDSGPHIFYFWERPLD